MPITPFCYQVDVLLQQKMIVTLQIIMEKDLNKIKLLTGETAAEFLKTVPKEYQSAATEAIYECLSQELPLIEPVIQRVARGIMRKNRDG